MNVLASLIKWMKTGNVALTTLTMMAIITTVIWMSLFGGSGKAAAQETSDTEEALEQKEESKAPQSAWGSSERDYRRRGEGD